MQEKMISTTIRCDDGSETAILTRFEWRGEVDYELSIQDSYLGRRNYQGLRGRFHRAWDAFWKKPIYYASVCVTDSGRLKRFLQDCLHLIKEDEISNA